MSLSDNNLYAYCDNNPVTRVDYDGEWWNIVVGGVVGAVGGSLNVENGSFSLKGAYNWGISIGIAWGD